ncbi:MAG: class II glutamine amidotransferase [Rhodospirillales bacterium]|nr:class II glutamine amidotransferase [Rhodospirillales bacterium]
MEDLIASPSHSLVAQSLHATESKSETNGDGFGIGWYGARPAPGLYREVRPAWSDENLRSLCAQVEARLFFAHVRAATGTATTRANCHPFAEGRLLFMHNGQIGGFAAIRRRVEAMIPDPLYPSRTGTTDSEAIFLSAVGLGLAEEPLCAIATVLSRVREEMARAQVAAPLRFTAALTDGAHLWAFRWASDDAPPTLYFRDGCYDDGAKGLVVVSEPIDGKRQDWHAVPPGHALIAAPDGSKKLALLEV